MYVLDTNVISELRRIRLGRGNPGVTTWLEAVNPDELYLSAISIEELEIGVLLVERRDPAQGRILRKWLNFYILPEFSRRILPIDTSIVLRSAGFHVPNPHPVRDGLIAATALIHGMTVVTRNVVHFEATGAAVINPWRD